MLTAHPLGTLVSVPEEFDQRLQLVEEAIDKHGAFIENYFLSLSKNHHQAQELTDDLFIHVLHRFKIEDITKLPFLRRKAYQIFIDDYRKRQRNPVRATELVPDIPSKNTYTLPRTEEEELKFKERFFEEYKEVELNQNQREALWLHCWYGYTFVEVGEIMQKPASTVGDWIKSARKAFAETLNTY